MLDPEELMYRIAVLGTGLLLGVIFGVVTVIVMVIAQAVGR